MTAVVDPQVLADLARDLGDRDLVRETVELYLGELPTRRAAMVQLAACGDVSTLRANAHSLRSASGLLGAMEMQELCRELELSADVADAGHRAVLIARWQQACDRVDTAMQAWARTPA
ncbi:MAG: Histidine kinase [Friedmanniella sp.]|nr:Histidine kinase [Friedmanniella sp.]